MHFSTDESVHFSHFANEPMHPQNLVKHFIRARTSKFSFSKSEKVCIWFLKPLNASRTVQKPSKSQRNELCGWNVRIWHLSMSCSWDSECVTERGIPNVESSSNPRKSFKQTWRGSRQGYNSNSGPVFCWFNLNVNGSWKLHAWITSLETELDNAFLHKQSETDSMSLDLVPGDPLYVSRWRDSMCKTS